MTESVDRVSRPIATDVQTNELTENLQPTRDILTFRNARTRIPECRCAELRAERDHWRAMYDAAMAAARAGIKSRSEAIAHPEGA